jgi:L-ascorbate metabolism protein UlaG (beta-lactamase superfamily)
MSTTTKSVRVRLVGGPTALIEIGGLRLLTDPTFDPPGPHPSGNRVLTKTVGPAAQPADLGHVDAVLLSHDQHADNLDDAGREFLKTVPVVISTSDASERLGGTTVPLLPWHHVTLDLPAGGHLNVVGVPAQHGPDNTERFTGAVTGFVLSGDDLPTTYVSGDNASLRVVEEVAHHAGPIDIAILFLGAARTPVLDAYLTLSSEQAAEAAAILDVPVVVPVHSEGWAHFTNDQASVAAAFNNAGIRDRLVLLAPGEDAAL